MNGSFHRNSRPTRRDRTIMYGEMWSDGTHLHLAVDLQLRSETFQDCQHHIVQTVMFWLCPVFALKFVHFVCDASRVCEPSSHVSHGDAPPRATLWHATHCGSSEHRPLYLRVPSTTRFLGNVHEGNSCGRPPIRGTFARLPPSASKSACASLRPAD